MPQGFANFGIRVLDASVPFIAAVFPKTAAPSAYCIKALDRFDAHDIFRHFVAGLTFHPQAKRRAMFDRERRVVEVVGEDRLRMIGIEEVDGLIILTGPVERRLKRIRAIEGDIARRGLQTGASG
jgi:hypothetical protein